MNETSNRYVVFIDASYMLIYLLAILIGITTCHNKVAADEYGPVCRNELNEPVDWYIGYKIPVKKKSTIKGGRTYAYIEGKSLIDLRHSKDDFDHADNNDLNMNKAKSPTAPIKSDKNIDDPESIISLTLKPIYANEFSSRNVNYIMYNDQPPAGGPNQNDARAHSKGVVIMDWQTQTGSWLIHSVPRFPKQRLANDPIHYPDSGLRYGQTFMCVSFDLENSSKFIERHLDMIKPIIYDSEMSEIFLLRYPEFAKLSTEQSAKTMKSIKNNDDIRLHQMFETLAGEEMDIFSKSRAYKNDIYNDWIMNYYQQSIAVESWRFNQGPNSLNSTCDDNSTFKTLNIDKLQLKSDQNDNVALVEWKFTNDHSKWAIGIDQGKPLVCVGDINRMPSQFTRGGGVVCMKNQMAWNKMVSFVDKTEECQSSLERPFSELSTQLEDYQDIEMPITIENESDE